VEIPKRSNKILIITSNDTNKDIIKENLEKVKKFILNRHKEKSKLFEKYIMTKQIGELKIDDKPINTPKKKLIVVVAFVTGFILSIFLVFFMQFVRSLNIKEETK